MDCKIPMSFFGNFKNIDFCEKWNQSYLLSLEYGKLHILVSYYWPLGVGVGVGGQLPLLATQW